MYIKDKNKVHCNRNITNQDIFQQYFLIVIEHQAARNINFKCHVHEFSVNAIYDVQKDILVSIP